ncbi:MAG: hypothetical protein ABIJ31_09055 [Pseudomonadota bacterium]
MKTHIGSLCFLSIMLLCFFQTTVAVADEYQDQVAAKTAQIEACKAVIAHKQGLIAEEQAGIDAGTKSLEQAKKIYDIGLEKYKNMEAEVKGIEDKINHLSSNIFIMRSTYKDFYNAYLAYKDAWYAKNYERMNIEYLKMWHYSHGFEEKPPYQDPVTGFYEVRKWFIKMGARWSIRSLHTVVSTINLVRSIVSIKEKISDVVSVANEGFKAVFDYASSEAIDTIKESAIENLKAAGSETYKVIDDTLAKADALSDPLGSAEKELELMVKSIEKKESFGYPSKEEAIEKMTDLIASSGELHEQATLDAKEVLAELGPVKDGIKGYEDAIADHKEAQRIYYEQIKVQREKIIQLEQEKSAIHYTYHVGNSGCTNYVSSLSVSSKNGEILSLNRETSSLTGYPTELDIRATTGIAGCRSASQECTNEYGNTIIVHYTYENGFSTELDSKLLSGSGTKLAFSSGKLSATGAGSGEEDFTFTFPGKIQFSQYVESDLACGLTSAVPTGNGEVKETRNFTIIEASDMFLIPNRYREMQIPVEQDFPKTYFTFFNKTQTPYEDEDFYIAYKLTGEDDYQYKKVDSLKVTVTDLKTHPDGIVTGKFDLDGYMKVDADTNSVKLASLTMYAEKITPTASFVDYQDQSVTITKGAVPLDKTIKASLVLTSGLTPEYGIDDFIKVKMIVDRFDVEKVYTDTGFVKENIFFENFNGIGSPIPIRYEITRERQDGYVAQTIKTGDFGEDLIGSVQYDDFYMTEPNKKTEYLSHKNEFYFEKSNSWNYFTHDVHGTTLLGHDGVTSFGQDTREILFDDAYTIGIRDFPQYSSVIYNANVPIPIKLIGGQMTTDRNRIYQGDEDAQTQADGEEDDLLKLNEKGLFLSSNKTGFVAGFNYNVVKLRMRESDGHRYFVLKILGPTNMDTHFVKWTFSDGTIQSGVFVQNGMIWESIIEPACNLKEVELFSRDMISQGKLEMVNFVTKFPSLYGIYEDEFVIRLQERYENTSGSYQLKDKKLMFVQDNWTDSSVDIHFPVDNSAMTLKKASGVDMVPVEEIFVTGNTIKFYLGMFPRRPLKVIQSPKIGSLDVTQNRIIYSAPDGFIGTASFRIDLYGALSNPYEAYANPEYSMKGIESRYLDVKVDFSGTSPVLWVTSVYKSPIEIYLSLEFDTVINSVDNSETNASVGINLTNDHMINYTPKSNIDLADDDVITLNGNYIMNLTCYRSRMGSRMINLPPGETVVFKKKYLQSLFYHIFENQIDTLQPGFDVWAQGFEYQMKKDGEDVPYIDGGYPLDSFDTLEITYNPPEEINDPKPAGLQLLGRQGNNSYKAFLFFFSQNETDGLKPGDIDGNGTIDLNDLMMVLNIISTGDRVAIAGNDVDNDGVIGMAEAIYIIQALK